MENMKDIYSRIRTSNIYILSKQVNEKILNLIKIKKKKGGNEKQIYIEESKKENNKKYNKKNISILKYYIISKFK